MQDSEEDQLQELMGHFLLKMKAVHLFLCKYIDILIVSAGFFKNLHSIHFQVNKTLGLENLWKCHKACTRTIYSFTPLFMQLCNWSFVHLYNSGSMVIHMYINIAHMEW